MIGRGALRPDPAEPLVWAGRIDLAGFPYVIRAIARTDAGGAWYELRAYIAPREPAASP